MKELPGYELVRGSARALPLRSDSVQTAILSPPYWGLRIYEDVGPEVWDGDAAHRHWWDATTEDSSGRPVDGARCTCGAWYGRLGLEPDADLYVKHIVEVMREVRRVLRPDGVVWLNIGDSYIAYPGSRERGLTRRAFDPTGLPNRAAVGRRYSGEPKGELKVKDLALVPELLAPLLRADGWYARHRIIWHKTNQVPGGVDDRPTSSYEFIYMLSKRGRYFWDKWGLLETSTASRSDRLHGGYPKAGQVAGPGARTGNGATIPGQRMIRDVWSIPTQAYLDAHFATFPERVPENCVLLGTPAAGSCADCGCPQRRVFRERLPVGWKPGCDCGADAVPALVLDPCAGSGTTAVAALRHGRRFIGVDPSGKYLRMAERRIDRIDAANAQAGAAIEAGQPFQGALFR